MPLVGQEIHVLEFEPPAELDALIGDPAVPRTGPAVVLFADCVDLDAWRAEPLEPQRSQWTEVAVGYHCTVRGRAATAFHYPYLLLSAARGDDAMAVADVQLTRYHLGCPAYLEPVAGQRCEATARTWADLPLVDMSIELTAPAPGALPDGLLLWVNRVRYPDLGSPGSDLDAGVWVVPALEPRVGDVWRGRGSATFSAPFGWEGTVEGEGWLYGTIFGIEGGEPL